jgi:hypothetical protein
MWVIELDKHAHIFNKMWAEYLLTLPSLFAKDALRDFDAEFRIWVQIYGKCTFMDETTSVSCGTLVFNSEYNMQSFLLIWG